MNKGTLFIGQPIYGQLVNLLNRQKTVRLSRENGGERYTKHFDAWQHLVIMLYFVQSIKDDEEKEKEQNRFDATLEQIKEALALLQKLLEAIKEAKESSVTTQKGLNAATQSADNAITGICSAIVQAQQTPVKTRLDDESLKQLNDNHTKWLGQEKQTLEDHHKRQEESWQKHSQRLTDIVKNNECVWISTKLFYAVGSLSLLSIITIAIEIAFYVYFRFISLC
jgi:hypothetical protein